MAKIKHQLGATLPLGALLAAPTVERLAIVLQHHLETQFDGCLVPLQELGDNPPLFLIAGVGGHIFTFLKLARLLGGNQPTYGVKAIGIDGRERTPERIEEIAARYVKEMMTLRPRGSFVLGGYSAGAILAFEVALQLQAAGRRVEHLIAFDAFAPGYPKPLSWLRRWLMHVNNLAQLRLPQRIAYLRSRLAGIRLKWFLRLGLGTRVAPEITGVDALPQAQLKRIWVSLQKARLRYRPQGCFDGPIVLFHAKEPMTYPGAVFDDPLMGWRRWTTHAVDAHEIPGSHLEVFQEANMPLIARNIAASIEKFHQQGTVRSIRCANGCD